MPWGLTRFHESGQSHFVTFCCYHRRRLFTTDASRRIFESALERVGRSFRLHVYGYVVMPEHVHLLLSEPQQDTLADALKSLKLRSFAVGHRQEPTRAAWYSLSPSPQRRSPKTLAVYSGQVFSGGREGSVFTEGWGICALALRLAELLRHLKGAELKVWVYLLTRGGPQNICYPTYEEIMRGAGVETKGTVSKAVNRLEKIGLIRVHNDGGTRRYLLRDPRLAVERLFELNEISRDELEDANALLERMELPLIEPKPTVVPLPVKKTAQGSS